MSVTIFCPCCGKPVSVELKALMPAAPPKPHRKGPMQQRMNDNESTSGVIRGARYVDDGKREEFDYPAWENAPS
jgi:hypothetical protein